MTEYQIEWGCVVEINPFLFGDIMKEDELMVCNICGQKVAIRKDNGYGCFPVQHKRANHIDNCHGFFEEGFKVKDS